MIGRRGGAVGAETAALERMRGIKKKTIHPHPDRSWSDPQSIAEAREAWKSAKPLIQTDVRSFDYLAARTKMPELVSDADGQLSGELDYWNEHLDNLEAFQAALKTETPKLEADDRMIETPDGEGEVTKVARKSITVRVDGEKKDYSWKDLGAEAIAKLAYTAFEGKETRYLLLQLAFAVAYDRTDAFWDLMLEFQMSDGAAEFKRQVTRYEKIVKGQ